MIKDDDKVKPFDVPIEEVEGATPRGLPVIDFGGVRVAYGLRRFNRPGCDHKRLNYDPSERRIWCLDCERTIEAFDAFMVYTRYFDSMVLDAKSKELEAREALGAHLIRRAAKNIDRIWGHKMAPCCPHCKRGIFPQEMLNPNSVSAEYEAAIRKRDGK